MLSLVSVPVRAQTTSGRAEFVNVPDAPPAPGHSQAVVVKRGNLVFLAGQVAMDATGHIVGKGDFRAQVTRALENLRR